MASGIGADRPIFPIQHRANDGEESSGRIGEDDSSVVDDSDSTEYGHSEVRSRTASGQESTQRQPPTMTSVSRASMEALSSSGGLLSVTEGEGLNGQHRGSERSMPHRPRSDESRSEGHSPNGDHVARQSALLSAPSSPQSLSPPSAAAGQRTSPVLIVRTYSVREGRKATYRVHSTTSVTSVTGIDDDSPPLERGSSMQDVTRHRATDRKSLRVQVAKLVGAYPEVCVDLSFNWTDIDQTSGARTALATGLLAGGRGKKLSIDLSNRRLSDLREGAEMRYRQGLAPREWRKAIVDSEATALGEALCKELQRVSREQTAMPEFGMVCHDQPLEGVVYPLVKTLAAHAGVLTGLARLDLNRYSRSAEVGEARPGSVEGEAAMEKYVVRLGILLATTRSLRELRLRMNGLTSIDLATLMVSGNATLARLDLSCNPVCQRPDGTRSLKGLRELVRHLRKDMRLIELDLSFCSIDGEAAALLMKGLDGHRSLERVNLAGNPIPPAHPIFADRRVQASPGIALHQ